MASSINDSMTFWKLLNDHEIEVPVIQRDYAQGRLDERVKQIRLKFVDDLINTLSKQTGAEGQEGKSLHLDFIYGRIEGKDKSVIVTRNIEAIENVLQAVQGYASNLAMKIEYKVKQIDASYHASFTKLIPLDGQQRLTTLFLLHWYLIQKMQTVGQIGFLHILSKFRYKTRKSTSEFFRYLTNIQSSATNSFFVPDKKLSEQIEQSTNFYKIWKNDPSVKGILVMLDAIHDVLKNKTAEELSHMWESLTTKKLITFDFLDLDNLNQTDELYVKMNARGKQLTDFEHFKAWLQEEDIKVPYQKWEDKLDTDWLDLFWRKKSKDVYEVDDAIYNFFKSVNLFHYIVLTQDIPIEKTFIEKLHSTNKDDNYIALKTYKHQNFFSPKSLTYLFSTLDSLTGVNLDTLDESLSQICCKPFTTTKRLSSFFINGNIPSSLPDRVYYYAFTLFINDVAPGTEQDFISKLQAWMRICRNLIYNTYIQNPENFINAIKSISELAKHKMTIEDELLQNDLKVSFFESQTKEEKKKLMYFTLGKKWKDKIVEYENHEYFMGQIDFLFDLIGENKEQFDLFVQYGDKLSNLFNGIDQNDFLLSRALLTKGNYLIHISGNKFSFCKSDIVGLRVRNDNWRKLFGNEEKLRILSSLLDDKRDLQLIKDSYQVRDWKYFIINHPNTISYCKNRFIDFYNDLDIRLIKDNTYSGKHTDLYLYVLFLRLQEKNLTNFEFIHKDVNHFRSINNYPSIEIKNNNKLILSINYSHTLESSKKGFEIKQELQPHTNLKFLLDDYVLSENGSLFKTVEDTTEMENVLNYTVDQFVKFDSIFD